VSIHTNGTAIALWRVFVLLLLLPLLLFSRVTSVVYLVLVVLAHQCPAGPIQTATLRNPTRKKRIPTRKQTNYSRRRFVFIIMGRIRPCRALTDSLLELVWFGSGVANSGSPCRSYGGGLPLPAQEYRWHVRTRCIRDAGCCWIRGGMRPIFSER